MGGNVWQILSNFLYFVLSCRRKAAYFIRKESLHMHTEMKYRFLIHYTLSFIGGYLGIYAIVSRADLFGNAQTANLLGVVRDLIGRNFSDMLLRVGALLIYMAAVILTVGSQSIFPQIFVLSVSGLISVQSCCLDSACRNVSCYRSLPGIFCNAVSVVYF